MAGWLGKNLGDAMLAGQAVEDIRRALSAGQTRAGQHQQRAVFVRHESEGRLHCEVMVYFSPAASDLGLDFKASPCARPARQGLDLLAGDAQAWALFEQ